MINVSNHPSSKWGEKQMKAALKIEGDIVNGITDLPFPNVDPSATRHDLQKMAKKIAEDIYVLMEAQYEAVHVMGEMGLTFNLIRELRYSEPSIRVVHATTERKVLDNPDGSKTTVFEFVQFREY